MLDKALGIEVTIPHASRRSTSHADNTNQTSEVLKAPEVFLLPMQELLSDSI